MHISYRGSYVSRNLALVSAPVEWPADLGDQRRTGLTLKWQVRGAKVCTRVGSTEMFWLADADTRIVTFTDNAAEASKFEFHKACLPDNDSPAVVRLADVRIGTPHKSPRAAPVQRDDSQPRLPRARCEAGMALVFSVGAPVPLLVPSFFLYADGPLELQYGIRGTTLSVCVLRLSNARLIIDLAPFPGISLFFALMRLDGACHR